MNYEFYQIFFYLIEIFSTEIVRLTIISFEIEVLMYSY